AQSSFSGYKLFFDDPGALRLSTTGMVGTDVAFYGRAGQPSAVGRSSGQGAVLDATVSADKSSLYVGVQGQTGISGGRYSLHVDGPASNYIETMRISTRLNAGSSGSDISGSNDSDFYKFEVPRSGNWV